MTARICTRNPCPTRPSSPSLLFLARKCHLQSTDLENKVSENRRWGWRPPERFQRIRGASPVPFASFQKLTWIDRGGYSLPPLKIYRHVYV